jgi:hypothetical protein
VVVSHFPVFCSGCLTGIPAGMPAALQPLFVRHGVDLYAAGHYHYYESLWPMRAPQAWGVPNTTMTPPLPTQLHFNNPQSTVYVTAGGGGPPGPDGGAGVMYGARAGSEVYSTGRLVAHNATHLTWTQKANSNAYYDSDGVLDQWTIVQHNHGPFPSAVPGIPAPPSPPLPPPPPPPPAEAPLQLVTMDICRHYWNWVCGNVSLIPGGAEGGGQAACCIANASDQFFSWRDQGSRSPSDLQLYVARPASASASYFNHTMPTPTLPPPYMRYRMGDYAEASYFGPRQGVDGVWTGVVNYSVTGKGRGMFGRWTPGTGAPLAVVPALSSDKRSSERGTVLLAKPLSYELLMVGGAAAGPGSDLRDTSSVAIWRPVPPAGFTALGHIITPSPSDVPRIDDVRVLRNDCVATCPARQLWCNARLPNGTCARFNPAAAGDEDQSDQGKYDGEDGTVAGWNVAAYISGAQVGSFRPLAPTAASGAVPVNLLFVETNSSKLRRTVPCIRARCLRRAEADTHVSM